MRIIGITGCSGAGKGEVARIFAECGYTVIDADAVYHSLLYKNSPLCIKLGQSFGATVLNGGVIDRKKLGAIVFSDKTKLDELNKITHTFVKSAINELVGEADKRGEKVVFIDAPQLFEADMQGDCEFVIGVVADDEIRAERVMRRDGITREQAYQRFASQHTKEFFEQNCDILIHNDSGIEELYDRVRSICQQTELKWEKH